MGFRADPNQGRVSRERPDLAPLIDHALLDPHQGREAIIRCCDEARHFGFAGVCVASRWVGLARERCPARAAAEARPAGW
jgi:deoxyribose-phosphate aldolase